MDSEDSIELFRQIIIACNQLTIKGPSDGFELLHSLENNAIIQDLTEKYDNETITYQFVRGTQELIDCRLLDGKYTPTKSGPLFKIAGVTMNGNDFLIQTTKPSVKKKINDFVKTTAVNITPSLIMHFIGLL
ncbi:hypothetical protein [Lactobacillus sp. 3B(2020)]|uniref:hypothetical protein n=1 Tax=Lactobacillus sp. 3B(2020) TaxID=2695882 RepID=UPI0015DF3B88|nr:hypothetical protein [Lactobacillus sp. 3B(2020)]QLL69555.1 hypothetical protein GTO83_02875 [Lactobacillus sp. 3B(2020)]